jgi:hypothetical protein
MYFLLDMAPIRDNQQASLAIYNCEGCMVGTVYLIVRGVWLVQYLIMVGCVVGRLFDNEGCVVGTVYLIMVGCSGDSSGRNAAIPRA